MNVWVECKEQAQMALSKLNEPSYLEQLKSIEVKNISNGCYRRHNLESKHWGMIGS